MMVLGVLLVYLLFGCAVAAWMHDVVDEPEVRRVVSGHPMLDGQFLAWALLTLFVVVWPMVLAVYAVNWLSGWRNG